MKDSELLPPPSAAFVLAQTSLMLRQLNSGNISELWHSVSRLDMAAYKATHLQDKPDHANQMRLFP